MAAGGGGPPSDIYKREKIQRSEGGAGGLVRVMPGGSQFGQLQSGFKLSVPVFVSSWESF